ncbi:unnamed protein product [Enterobius vermicularis]|uniref:Mannosyltransferase n=1 Tax=Enterobius vermicularis TaxID=51028 RepID=A0A158QAC0_ENTVE|nr:unnamed protein product [Enterobius vermicularis]
MDNKLKKAVWVATVFTALFRCELILLFGTIFFLPIIMRKLSLFGWDGAVMNVAGISIPIDSIFWRRVLWPEGEVWWFNVVQNKSHHYGVYPFFWYFYSVLPRSLLASYLLVPLGILIEKRLLRFVLPAIFYIMLYSLLPHKELRFIIYTFPLLNLAAASVFFSWKRRRKSWFSYAIALVLASHILLNAVGTGVITYASSWNYPGSQGIGYLQFMQRYDRNKPISVYIDNFAAQTGVSRFLQFYDSWEYNKTENLQGEQLKRFDFLLIGSYRDRNIARFAKRKYSATHRLLYSVRAFQ